MQQHPPKATATPSALRVEALIEPWAAAKHDANGVLSACWCDAGFCWDESGESESVYRRNTRTREQRHRGAGGCARAGGRDVHRSSHCSRVRRLVGRSRVSPTPRAGSRSLSQSGRETAHTLDYCQSECHRAGWGCSSHASVGSAVTTGLDCGVRTGELRVDPSRSVTVGAV